VQRDTVADDLPAAAERARCSGWPDVEFLLLYARYCSLEAGGDDLSGAFARLGDIVAETDEPAFRAVVLALGSTSPGRTTRPCATSPFLAPG